MITGLLLIAFIATNILWIVYLNQRDKRDQTERYQLIERKLFPHKEQLPPERLIEHKSESKRIEDTILDEFDLVGEVNPPTPLRNE